MTKQNDLAEKLFSSLRFLKYCLEHGIHDDKTLWLFIYLACGYKIPTKAVCADHVAPFTILSDLFFERVTNCLILGTRSGGKTFLIIGVLGFLNLLFKPQHTTTDASAILSQAKDGFKHLKKLIQSAWWLSKKNVIEVLLSRTRFTNGAEVEIVTASKAGVNARHPNVLILDEVDLIPDWDILEESFSMSMTKNGFKAQNIFLSTRKTATGTMQKLIDESQDRGFKLYVFCVWEICERCIARPCDRCKIAGKGQGKAKKSNGFYFLSDLETKIRGMDARTFKAQWSCETPVSQGSFFDFDREHHVIDVSRFCERYNVEQKGNRPIDVIPKSWQRFAGLDFGYTHPTVFLGFALSPTDDTVYCFQEAFQTRLTENQVVQMWRGAKKTLFGRMVFDNTGFTWDVLDWLFVVADSASPSIIRALNEIRRGKTPVTRISKKFEKNKDYSYGKVRERLSLDSDTGYPRLIFFDTCENTIREHEGLSLKSGNEFLDLKAADHTTDATRYALSRLA